MLFEHPFLAFAHHNAVWGFSLWRNPHAKLCGGCAIPFYSANLQHVRALLPGEKT